MKRTNELCVRICPETMRIQLESTENGVTACKEIAPDTFFACIKSSVKRDDVASGFLPQHCFSVSIGADGSKDYCIWHPELYADISYFGTEYPHFPLPRLVFGFQVSQEGKVCHCRLGVVEDGSLRENSPMYVYPFSNVTGFSLCIGNNALPTYKKPHTLATLPDFLLRLPNNNDSFNPQNNKLHLQYRELLEYLKHKEPAYYYADVLVPSGKTIQDFINGRL
jgi:hypothetical protein